MFFLLGVSLDPYPSFHPSLGIARHGIGTHPFLLFFSNSCIESEMMKRRGEIRQGMGLSSMRVKDGLRHLQTRLENKYITNNYQKIMSEMNTHFGKSVDSGRSLIFQHSKAKGWDKLMTLPFPWPLPSRIPTHPFLGIQSSIKFMEVRITGHHCLPQDCHDCAKHFLTGVEP